MDKQERNDAIIEMALGGLKNRVIAETFGLSTEAVRRIVLASGIDLKGERERAEQKSLAFKSEVTAWVLDHPGCSLSEIASAFELNISTITDFLERRIRHLVIDNNTASPMLGRFRWTDDQMVASLQAASVGIDALSQDNYDIIRKSNNHDWPSGILILKRFGKWSAACAAAGVQPGRAMRENYDPKFTLEEVAEALADFLMISPSGSVDAYELWAKENPGSPSSGSIRNYLGSWTDARLAALELLRWRWND